jgi:hypothetical protein
LHRQKDKILATKDNNTIINVGAKKHKQKKRITKAPSKEKKGKRV